MLSSVLHNSLGDYASRVAMLKMMVHSLKIKLGLVPDLNGNFDSVANTSLEFHAGGNTQPYNFG